jgi:hypothetical protein
MQSGMPLTPDARRGLVKRIFQLSRRPRSLPCKGRNCSEALSLGGWHCSSPGGILEQIPGLVGESSPVLASKSSTRRLRSFGLPECSRMKRLLGMTPCNVCGNSKLYVRWHQKQDVDEPSAGWSTPGIRLPPSRTADRFEATTS